MNAWQRQSHAELSLVGACEDDLILCPAVAC